MKREFARGQSITELAVLLPLLMLITLGIADFGRVFYAHITLSGSSYAGAAYGSSGAAAAVDQAGIQTAALADASTLAGPTPTIVSSTALDPYGFTVVTVTASSTFQPMFPYPGLPGSLPLSRTVKMRVSP